MGIELDIEILGHPVSANAIWRGSGRRVYKTPEARRFEDLVFICTGQALRAQHGLGDLGAYKGRPIRLEISVTKPSWRGKTKATKDKYVRPDLSNFIKLCEDSVFKALALDDSAVVELIARKLEVDGPLRTFVRIVFI